MHLSRVASGDLETELLRLEQDNRIVEVADHCPDDDSATIVFEPLAVRSAPGERETRLCES
jgi:hypothetical protein